MGLRQPQPFRLHPTVLNQLRNLFRMCVVRSDWLLHGETKKERRIRR